MVNNKGPSTLSCGTPDVTSPSSDIASPTFTLCLHPLRKSPIHSTTLLSGISTSTFLINVPWGTLSIAFSKSMKQASTCFPSSTTCTRSSNNPANILAIWLLEAVAGVSGCRAPSAMLKVTGKSRCSRTLGYGSPAVFCGISNKDLRVIVGGLADSVGLLAALQSEHGRGLYHTYAPSALTHVVHIWVAGKYVVFSDVRAARTSLGFFRPLGIFNGVAPPFVAGAAIAALSRSLSAISLVVPGWEDACRLWRKVDPEFNALFGYRVATCIKLELKNKKCLGSISGQVTLDFRMWESCQAMPLVSGFSWNLPFPPPFHSGAAPYSPQSPSLALKTSMLSAVQISSLFISYSSCERVLNGGNGDDHRTTGRVSSDLENRENLELDIVSFLMVDLTVEALIPDRRVVEWIGDFLRGRRQRVKVGEAISE
ncbi:hypothetical protein PR048_009303 [Dryococelus australis]|uniref:Uncharacterized protein n=1 Tax=Dryococelus australis TaxID=614101 RepID=A0ABQ9HZI6_9NEOP|nr:hypothetical protein PR048_009303 [Dryococelus australis]